VIGAERSKNRRPLTVQLSTQAWAIIEAQPRFVDCDFVFSISGVGPSNNWDPGKKRLNKAAGLVEASWRIHDIRRTGASGMQRLGVRTEVIERVLGHYSGSFKGLTGVYQVDPLERECRAALQRWADHVEQLVAGKPAKVLSFRGRRR